MTQHLAVCLITIIIWNWSSCMVIVCQIQLKYVIINQVHAPRTRTVESSHNKTLSTRFNKTNPLASDSCLPVSGSVWMGWWQTPTGSWIWATHTDFGYETTHLDERVYNTDVGTGIEDLVEARLSVDQLQLVELLVILWWRQDDVKGLPHPKSVMVSKSQRYLGIKHLIKWSVSIVFFKTVVIK